MPDLEKDGENIQDNSNKQAVDPTDKMWSLYLAEAEKVDKALVERWTGDMDGILIFAGLFSASVTAFIIESYKKLSPDSGDTTVALLMQISSQLVAISNGTNLNAAPPPSTNIQFQPTSSMVAVNILWFLSLALALICALSATLVQQWARYYLQLIERRPSPNKRARMRAYLYGGAGRFKTTAAVEAIPTLLHISLLLFFVGVVIFLFPIDLRVALTMAMVVTIGFPLYITVTILPIRHKSCPYQTPLSSACWNLLRYFYLLSHNFWYTHEYDSDNRIIYPNDIRGRLFGRWEISLANARELQAMTESPKRHSRDMEALHWTLESATDLSQLEQFLDAVPAFYRHSSGNADNLGLIGLWTSVSYRSESFLVQCQRDVQTPGRLFRGMPAELVEEVLSLSAVWDLQSLGLSCHHFYWRTQYHLHGQLPGLVRDHIEDTPSFDNLLTLTQSVISGSTALRILDPLHTEEWTEIPASEKQDIDIYTPAHAHYNVVKYLGLIEGYRLKVSFPTADGWVNCPYQGASVRNVTTLCRDNALIHVVSAVDNCVLSPILRFRDTVVMNFVSSIGVFCAYPKLISARVGVANSALLRQYDPGRRDERTTLGWDVRQAARLEQMCE